MLCKDKESRKNKFSGFVTRTFVVFFNGKFGLLRHSEQCRSPMVLPEGGRGGFRDSEGVGRGLRGLPALAKRREMFCC